MGIEGVGLVGLASFSGSHDAADEGVSCVDEVFHVSLVPSFFRFAFVFTSGVFVGEGLAFGTVTRVPTSVVSPSRLRFGAPVHGFHGVHFQDDHVSRCRVRVEDMRGSNDRLVVGVCVAVWFVVGRAGVGASVNGDYLFPDGDNVNGEDSNSAAYRDLANEVVYYQVCELPVVIASYVVARLAPEDAGLWIYRPLC